MEKLILSGAEAVMTAFARFHEWSGLWEGTAFSGGQGEKYFLWLDEFSRIMVDQLGIHKEVLTFVAQHKK